MRTIYTHTHSRKWEQNGIHYMYIFDCWAQCVADIFYAARHNSTVGICGAVLHWDCLFALCLINKRFENLCEIRECVFIQVGSIYGDFIKRNIHKDYFDGSTLFFHAGDKDRDWSQRTCNGIGRWAEQSGHEDWIRWISKAKCNQQLCIHAAQPNQTIKIQLNNTHLLELRTRTQQRNTSSRTADLCLNNICLCVRCIFSLCVCALLSRSLRSSYIFSFSIHILCHFELNAFTITTLTIECVPQIYHAINTFYSNYGHFKGGSFLLIRRMWKIKRYRLN